MFSGFLIYNPQENFLQKGMFFMSVQLELFNRANGDVISLESVFQAYFACRKNKRRTKSALRFEMNLEENLIALWRDLNNGTYQISRSNAFIVTRPVIREIFAADFRDRIVHHLVIERLLPLLEASFYPNSYSCRKGKGTLYGIRSIYRQLKECSKGFTQECFVLRLDIRAFFLNINHAKLVERLDRLIVENYNGSDKRILRHLVKQIVFHRPQELCIKRGGSALWELLPRGKSLFYQRPGFGLPIGNLTSQLFANFYLNAFDNFVKQQRGMYYGRYVDDLVLIHRDKAFLKAFLTQVSHFLNNHDGLKLHPRKIILSHYAKGFSFIGAFIRPYRLYVGKRLKGCFLKVCTQIVLKKMPIDRHCLSVLNSYLGFLRHYNSFRLRVKGWNILVRGKIKGILTDFYVLKINSCTVSD